MTDYKHRFEELLTQVRQIPIQRTQGFGRWVDSESFHKWFSSALNLLELVFGTASTFAVRFRASPSEGTVTAMSFEVAKGIFAGAADEYSKGYLKGLRREISGEFVIDLCLHAETLLEEGHIESAAVLAAAALEDCFKKRVEESGNNTDDKTLNDYIGILKSNGVLSGASSRMASGFPKFRNAAMHADWSKINEIEIRTITAFVKGFAVQD